MPLSKPYPPVPVDYSDWADLADNYAGKATTIIVDASGKGDYSTIQEAVDSLPYVNAGEVLVRAGEYLLTSAVVIDGRQDLVIRGVGKATRLRVADKQEEALTLDASSGQRLVHVSDGGSFQVGQHVCVRDSGDFEVNIIEGINENILTMKTDLANTYQVASGGRVYTCHSAVYITGSSKHIKLLNLLIDGNRVNQEFSREGYYPEEHQGDGVRLSASTERCTVQGCSIKSVAAHGICIGGTGHLITGNECWDNVYDGVNVEPGCDQVLVKANHCYDQVDWNGIQVGYGTNPVGTVAVVDNICRGNRQGIAAQGGSSVVISGNILQESREDGIEVYSLDRFVISGNVITGADDVSDMTNTGIHIEQGSSVGVITGNLIELCSGHGIHIENGAYITVSGNTLRKLGKHGIKIDVNGRDSAVTGNTVIGADQGDTETYSGVAVTGDRCVVSGNRLDDCDRYCIHVGASADRTLVLGNQCTQHVGASLGYILDEGSNTESAHNITS